MAAPAAPRQVLYDAAVPAALVVLLLGSSATRAAAIHGGADPVRVGVVFGLVVGIGALALPEVRAGLRTRPSRAGLVLGAALGVLLLLPGLWLSLHGYPSHPAGLAGVGLVTWAPAVTLVAVVEEVAFRGALQPRLRRFAGPGPALVLSAIVFAAIHLPLYGAAALPLDIGVGLLLGALRERTGSVAGCALAHVIADLGYWWVA